MSTKIKLCECVSKFQDQKYGPGKRVHNQTMKEVGQKVVWRCTVCGREQV